MFESMIRMGLLTLLASALVSGSFSQTYEWSKQMEGEAGSTSQCVTVDEESNVYSSGFFIGTADLNPGEELQSVTSSGDYDIFIQKFNSDGDLIWAKNIGGVGRDIGKSIKIDASGNVLITGTFHNTVDFDPSEEVFNLTSDNNKDVFILKLNSLGNFLWVKQLESNSQANVLSMVTDMSGQIYLGGTFFGFVDMDPSNIDVFNFASGENTSDMFILKLTSQGDFIWAKQLKGTETSNNDINSIRVDQNENVYLAGQFGGAVDFDPGEEELILESHSGAATTDLFVQKLNADGNLEWVKKYGGPSEDKAKSLALDDEGNVFVTGTIADSVSFEIQGEIQEIVTEGAGAGPFDSQGVAEVFIQKFDNSGNLLWFKHMVGSGQSGVGNTLETDEFGNLYLSAIITTQGTIDFDPGEEEYIISGEAGGPNMIIEKLDNDGELIWIQQYSGDEDVNSSFSFLLQVMDFKVIEEDEMVLSGFFGGTIDFDPEIGEDYFTASSENFYNSFVLKIGKTEGTNSTVILENEQLINCYPNPTAGFIQIKLEGYKSNSRIEVIDNRGKTLLAENTNDSSLILDLSAYESGLYFIKVQNNGKQSVLKVVKN